MRISDWSSDVCSSDLHFDRQGRACYGAGIRSGALLDALGLLFGRWHFAPQDGASLLRELTRIKSVEIGKPLGEYWYFEHADEGVDPVTSVEIAGNVIAPDLLPDLTVKTLFDRSPGSARRTLRHRSAERREGKTGVRTCSRRGKASTEKINNTK